MSFSFEKTMATSTPRADRLIHNGVSDRHQRHGVLTRRGFLRLAAAQGVAWTLSYPALSRAARTFPASASRSAFETRYYHPLDLQRAAREQWGQAARVTSTGRHLYDWKAVVNGKPLPLDLARAVSRQYGRSWQLVMTGLGLYDWKATRFDALPDCVLPVMLVSSDRFYDIAGVARGLLHFRSVLARVQTWYRRRAGVTFRLLSPLIVPSQHSSSHWNDTCRRTTQDKYRFDLFHKATEEFGRHLPPPGERLRVVLAPYSGDSPDVWQGAAAAGPFATIPAYATSIHCPGAGRLSEQAAGVAYAVGHELGHTFGLGHPGDAHPSDPQWQRSIMQSAVPPDAILLPGEVRQLRESRYFR